jgi:hypothetical protein
VHLGKAHEELVRRALGLIELAGAYQTDNGVECFGQIVFFLQRVKDSCCSSFFSPRRRE